MKVQKIEKPVFCPRCGRHIDDALREQLAAMQPCDDECCLFREEIERGIEQKRRPFKISVSSRPCFKIVEAHNLFTIKKD